jgi:hypothetical protein
MNIAKATNMSNKLATTRKRVHNLEHERGIGKAAKTENKAVKCIRGQYITVSKEGIKTVATCPCGFRMALNLTGAYTMLDLVTELNDLH